MSNKFTLDKIDLKILLELSIDCTMPINSIAKKARVSRETATYRISQLEKNRIITKYQTIIDISKTGTSYGRIGIKLINNTTEEHQKAIDLIKSHKKTILLISTRGRYDMVIAYLYKDISEFSQFIDYIKSSTGQNIEKFEISILRRLYTCANNFMDIRDEIIPPAMTDYTEKIDNIMDKTDSKIIEELRDNSRINTITLAKKLNHSTKTISERIKSLEKNKIILRYQIAINPRAFNLEAYHIFWSFFKFDEKETKRFKNHLLTLKRLSFITEAIGSSDMECEILAGSERELYEELNSIKEKFPTLIKGFDIMLMEEVHENF